MNHITRILAATAFLAPAFAAMMEGTTFIYTSSKSIMYAPDQTTILKQWNGGGYSAFFSDSGTVFYTTGYSNGACSSVMGYGAINEVRWDGTLIRSITAAQMGGGYFHHAFNITANGTILAIALESYNGSCGEKIVEYDPNQGKVVWVWHTNDHEGSGLANKLPSKGGNDPFHVNGVDLDPVRNTVIFSAHNTYEVYIIDHSVDSTTAKGSTGGDYGMGGDILWRFGMPTSYGATGLQYIQTAVHSARFVKQGYPGAGNVLLFANESPQSTSDYATGYEIQPVESGKAFTKRASGEFDYNVIFAGVSTKTETNMGGMDKLANGNWLVTYIGKNMAAEYDAAGGSSQAFASAAKTWTASSSNGIRRFPTCFSGLTKVAESDAAVAALQTAAGCDTATTNLANPEAAQAISLKQVGQSLQLVGMQGVATARILDLAGREKFHGSFSSDGISILGWRSGTYIAQVQHGKSLWSGRISLVQ